MNKIFVMLLCSITILMSLSSCNKPDISEYYGVSSNIVWHEGSKIDTKYPGRIYYEIEGVPTNNFIACRWRAKGVGAAFYPRLMQHRDYKGKWELDVSSAKLIISKHYNFTDKEWSTLGQSMFLQEVCQIDSVVAEQLANDILADSPNYIDPDCYGQPFLLDNEGNNVSLQFTLKEYCNLSFVARILKHDEKYYIEIREDVYSSEYLLCSDDFAFLLDQVCIEYDLKT